ncbi:MAG: alkaline phosphatase D family protein [Methyloversatilis sp.]|nr:alkaline phosphatase D family protein [Methyloversatilis sp.]
MSKRLSITFEQVVAQAALPPGDGRIVHDVDVLVIGSGYGASVAASRLAGAIGAGGAPVTLTVLERGREYLQGDFPEDAGLAPRHVRILPDPGPDGTPAVIGYEEGLFDLRGGNGVGLLVGNGLGGGSLINASVAEMPDPDHLASLRLPAAWRNYFRHPDFARDQAAVERFLGAVRESAPADERKYAALQRLGRALESPVVPARLTVSFTSGPNAVGVHQDACLRCGNCVTGCNVGAKNSLDQNLLPLAVARGAKLITGATVVSVRPGATAGKRRWIVKVRRTRASRVESAQTDGPDLWEVAASHVILGAGSIGSTEILMRSRDMEGLQVSPRLGDRFSTNGDGIATGFAQASSISPVGSPDQSAPATTGPTIRGILRMRLDEHGVPVSKGGTPVAIEDGAVPHTLRHLFGETVVTAALFNRLADGKLPARLKVPRGDGNLPDPLACSSDVIDHSQLLLVMGDDGARGRLMRRGTGARAVAVPDWPDAAGNLALTRIDACLGRENLGAGFDGGQYVPNPGWRLLPGAAAGVMSGNLPGGMAVSVHPLGGCAAADTAADGVVDEAGRVFSGMGSAVHEGLYVMDGAVLPGATAVNPFLMISVMAWRAAGKLLATETWTESPVNTVTQPLRGRNPVARETPAPVAIRFSERMSGALSREPDWVSRAMCGPTGSTLSLRCTLSVPDLDAWLEAPGETLLSGEVALLTLDAGGGELVLPEWSDGSATVRLLARDRLNKVSLYREAVSAMRAYSLRRIADKTARRSLSDVSGFLSVALMHAQSRMMEYRFEWSMPGRSLEIVGRKRLAYRVGNRPVFEAMTVLDATLRLKIRGDEGVRRIIARHHESDSFELRVNLLDMARAHPPQITAMPHLPAAIQSFARLGAFAARCILQTSFWEFGLDTIKPAEGDALRSPDPSPLPVFDGAGRPTLPTAHVVQVPLSSERPECFALRLLHYAQPGAGGDPVVLLHGLAQGSRIFSTELDENMACAMWRAGFDVWLVDYRLSNLVLPTLPRLDWDMDDIAQHDIPAALNFVNDHYNGERPLRVFAHCVGATTLTMALLKNDLAAINLTHVAMNAIHPWVMPSLANNLRARLVGFLRARVPGALLDPRPSGRGGLASDMFDRIAMALARYQEARIDGMAPDECCLDHPHHDRDAARVIERLICDRMTVLYGRMWKHGNLDPRTHRDFRQMIGAAPPGVYRQLYHLNRRERVTNRHGENTYLTADNLLQHWKPHTLLLHGEDSEVFDPQSARRSAAGLRQFVQPSVSVQLKCVPGFGHMDVIFSDPARAEVYPLLRDFFRAPQPSNSPDPINPAHRPPEAGRILTGPFIRGARRSAGHGVEITLWAELDTYSTQPGKYIALRDACPKANAIEGALGNYRRMKASTRPPPKKQQSSKYVALRAVRTKAYAIDGARGNYHWMKAQVRYGCRHELVVHDFDPVGATQSQFGYVVWDAAHAATSRLTVLPGWFVSELSRSEANRMVSERCIPLDDFPWFRRLASNETLSAFRFLVGSCRYPSQFLDGGLADEVYDGMLSQVLGDDGVDMVFMLGDQIYADATAGLIDSDDLRDRYTERYRTAFGSPHFARLCASVPVHFAVDDHEIDDQWSGEPARREQTAQAMHIAAAYQWRFPQIGMFDYNGLAYALPHPDEVACPVFVMDARFEREYRHRGNLGAARMIHPRQMALLERWLIQAQAFDGPKFIVSSVVLAPFERHALDRSGCIDLRDGTSWTEDGWGGYPATLAWLIQRIVELDVRKVVFVGGDQHLSSVSELDLHFGERSVRAWQVVASGLYAPLPLASLQREEMATAADVIVQAGVSIRYSTRLLKHDFRHFVRVDARHEQAHWTLEVRTCDATGATIDAHPSIRL